MPDHGTATRYDVLIVGAGHGGSQTAVALRQRGFTGSIGMVGEEPDLPYERPPLSKDYLAGVKSFERILIRPVTFWGERGIDVRVCATVVAVDAVAHSVSLAGGENIGYGQLVWAAGGHARRLACEGHHLAGVHSVRTRADVDRLLGELATTSQVAVVGGGYIGLEAASALSKLGKAITVLEAQNRVLARVAGPTLSRFYEDAHRDHGVDIRLSASVERIEEDGGPATSGRVGGVRLADGSSVPAQMVIVGIGIVPAVASLLEAGAQGSANGGVAVDAHCRTSLADVFAIGDCALHANRFAGGRHMRVESVQNANDMGMTVAKAITGTPEAYDAVPWFWSNQYDLKLQTVGLSVDWDQEIIRGDPAGGGFCVVYLKDGAVIALDCVNATRDYVQGKALVIGGIRADPALLADPAVPLKSLLPV